MSEIARRARIQALALALAACALASPVRADDAAMSRFHYEQASRHYAAGRFDRAVQEFFLAQRASPNPRTLYNIGLCFLRLSRHEDAFYFLGEYLAQADDAEGADERRRFAESSLESLAPRVARVVVTSAPEGAAIFVDQREHGSYGVTPRVLALSPGSHRLWVELEGHRLAEAEVTAVVGREVRVALTPERIVGRLRVEAPEGVVDAQVRVYDGRGRRLAVGEAPLVVAAAPGRLEVEVEAVGHQPSRQFVEIEADAEVTLRASLRALPQPTGDLTVTANVGDAVVELGDEPVGLVPLVLPELPAGEHELRIRAPGRLPFSERLEIPADVRTWVTVQLAEPPRGRSPVTWALGGVAGASWIGALTLGLMARARAADFAARWNEPGGGPVDGLHREARRLGLATDVLLAVGLVAVVGGVLLYALTGDREGRRSSATVHRRPR
ncbi:MAG: PEGA domain-containing protein [Myxococcales bacterium]|nr:PEGA domain-containing protein [Myxococcales bacterium]